jgi:hypothetical protein
MPEKKNSKWLHDRGGRNIMRCEQTESVRIERIRRVSHR